MAEKKACLGSRFWTDILATSLTPVASMDSLYSVQIIAYVWMIVGVLGIIGCAVLVFREGPRATGWGEGLFLLGIGFAGATLFSLGFALAGWPAAGLSSLRITGIIVTGLAFVLAFRIRPVISSGPPGTNPTARTPRGRCSVAGGSILLVILTWLSFQIGTLPISTTPLVTSAAVTATVPVPASTNLLSTTWSVTLVLLAGGTVIFLSFFARSVGRGGAPKIETHWEGIGGGVGGWRMSSSLGYLAVAGVLALLFTVLLLQFDSRERDRDHTSQPTPTPVPATAAR